MEKRMNMNTHDPREHIRGIHQILISDKKRIGFLFGAGSSFATGVAKARVPAIAEMTKLVVAETGAHSPEFEGALNGIRDELGEAYFNIETLLSSIEAKRAVIGNGNLNGLDATGFAKLVALVKTQVVKHVSVHEQLSPEDRKNLSHSKLSNWIDNARRRFPAELFTTNYDYLFEIALEGSGIPYFDGFSGSYEPFFFAPSLPESINISTPTEEEEYSLYIDINKPMRLWKEAL